MTHDDTGGSVPALRTTRLGKRYGRTVAICGALGEDLGAIMVRQGMA